MDATGSLSASFFAARRLPEINGILGGRTSNISKSERYLESGGCKTSSRHLRRRATSHRPRKRSLRPRDQMPTGTSRKSRRQHATYLKEIHLEGTSTKWIPTHLWHAKRFKIITEWGWRIPVQHNNRGTKASIRLLREKSLVQDVTWRMRPLVLAVDDTGTFFTRIQRLAPEISWTQPNDRMNSCIFYRADRFPESVGPISWWLSSTNPPQVASSLKGTRYLYIFCHPSIFLEISDSLKANGFVFDEPTDLCSLSVLSSPGQSEQANEEDLCIRVESNLLTSDVRESFYLGSSNAIGNLFQRRILKGACAIGESDRAALTVEYPTMLSFPRDFPDTDEGARYWEAASEWAPFRSHEGQRGRVKGKAGILALNVAESVGYSDSMVVSIRGDHLAPFRNIVDALRLGVGKERGPAPLQLKDAEQILSYCRSLSDSLTLPGIVLCRVIVVGQGRPKSGDLVFFEDDSIGFVTTIDFAYSIGTVRGIAAINARSLLELMGNVCSGEQFVLEDAGNLGFPVTIQDRTLSKSSDAFIFLYS